MRKVQEAQMKLGEVDISEIKFDPRSRDEIPKLLRGLQYIYCNFEIRKKVFDILERIVPEEINKNTGRPGMELWKILVLGTLRINCNWDYDKLQEIANNHYRLREILGHNFFNRVEYPLQTLKDNVSLLTPEILMEISDVIADAGHKLVKKKEETLEGRCDSFVLETNVHYPTDINLLFDAIKKVISLISKSGITGYRQSKHNLKKIKKLFRKIQNLKHSSSRDEIKKVKKEEEIKLANEKYIKEVEYFLLRVKKDLDLSILENKKVEEIKSFVIHAERQINQIDRRVLKGEKIPHNEKIFSIFEPYTEWISKGKAGVPFELGLRVCILEDQFGFILNHKVMEKETDEKVTVPIVKETKSKFSDLRSCSFDKGFYTPGNKLELEKILEEVILPKKGKLSAVEKEKENSESFVTRRRKHSAVESGINALENHGLDVCPDKGIDGFKRYVALSVLARNIQILGNILQKKELKQIKRIENSKQAA